MAERAKRSTRKGKAMSSTHKAALAAGREEGRAVRRYLEALESTKPRRGRRRTSESITRRLEVIDTKLLDADVLARLHLIEERNRLQAELAEQGDDAVDLPGLEEDFVAVAADYSERKGISYSTWRESGVSASVLRQAGIARTRG